MRENDIFDLSGKVILITGGAGYLGSAMSEAVAKYGANVVIASRNITKCSALASDLNDRYGGKCLGLQCDITKTSDIEALVCEIYNKYGHIDGLINNASGSTPGFIENFADEDWEKGINESVNSVFRVTKAVLPYMIKGSSGSIVNISSMYGVVAPDPKVYNGDVKLNNPANYGVGKAGIIQFTKYIAAYYGRVGIRCNAIVPGPFPHPIVQKNSDFVSKLADKTMLGRIGKPHELQGIAVLLLSDAASYITGQSLCIDGGWTSW